MGSGCSVPSRFEEAWAEFERLRHLIPERADFHLHNWGIWRRGDKLTDGYDTHSTCLENFPAANNETDDNRRDANDAWNAEVCDAIIDELPMAYRHVLSNLYETSVMTMRLGYMEQVLVEAAALFWTRAMKKGLT